MVVNYFAAMWKITLAIHICDVIKQNQSEVRNIDFKIEPNKAKNVFCFLLCLGNLLISLEPIDQL